MGVSLYTQCTSVYMYMYMHSYCMQGMCLGVHCSMYSMHACPQVTRHTLRILLLVRFFVSYLLICLLFVFAIGYAGVPIAANEIERCSVLKWDGRNPKIEEKCVYVYIAYVYFYVLLPFSLFLFFASMMNYDP